MSSTSNPRVELFHGAVTAKFSDALVASTDDALILREDDREPVYFFPYKDIYFEFLERSGKSHEQPGKGEIAYWNVSAVGEGRDNVMWSLDVPASAYRQLADHGAFSHAEILVEANPDPDPAHQPSLT